MRDRRTLSVFLSECRKNFAQTGALAPSSRALAHAMTVFVSPGDAPRRILEVGPGTGVFTEDIARRMGPFDHLDVYEINPIFADHVEDRFAHDPCFEAVQGRLSLYRRDVLDLPRDAMYDMILSSLPLNNFEPAKVRAFFETFMAHLVPGGVLSYFEYVLVRAVRRYLSSAPERERLRQVAEISEEFIASYQVRREAVFLNIPPAVARHLVKPLLHTLPAQRAARALRPAAAVQ